MKDEIVSRGRAGYPLLYCPSDQEVTISEEIKKASTELKRNWFGWTCTRGLFDASEKALGQDTAHPVKALQRILELSSPKGAMPSVYTLLDFRTHITNSTVLRLVRDCIPFLKKNKSMIIFAGPDLILPPEIKRETVTVELSMPTPDTLVEVLDGINSKRVASLTDNQKADIVRAARGLTVSEAENAFALATSQGDLTPRNIWHNKAQVVSREELQFISNTTSLDQVGGLDLLKAWLLQRKNAFSKDARDYGLRFPKGIVLVGPPGVAKSMMAKALGGVYDCPTMRLSIGACMHELIGRSERILREAIYRAEAIAPVILWLDEIEKMFAGSQSSGHSDSGLFRRMFAEFLTWLADRTSQVFVCATANAVYDLPPELTRCGRFDQVFWIDLPNNTERQAILTIHAGLRKNVDLSGEDVAMIAAQSNGYSGAELEHAIEEAMYEGFCDGMRPTTANDVILALKRQHPTSEVYRDEIRAMRSWANHRCRPASSLERVDPGRSLDEDVAEPVDGREAFD